MVNCDLVGGAAGSGRAETLCCRSHTQTCLLPRVSLEIVQSLQHLGLYTHTHIDKTLIICICIIKKENMGCVRNI